MNPLDSPDGRTILCQSHSLVQDVRVRLIVRLHRLFVLCQRMALAKNRNANSEENQSSVHYGDYPMEWKLSGCGVQSNRKRSENQPSEA